jgi:pyridoxine kinase
VAILSIQSSVIFGYVGNSIAAPVLQTLGHDVWRIDTVNFSNHPGYGNFTGSVKGPKQLNNEIKGICDLGILPDCEVILSGYLGEVDTATCLLETINLVKKQNKAVLYILDPVIGDDDQIYVKDGLVEVFKNKLLPKADIVIPNRSELGWLSGIKILDLSTLKIAAMNLIKRGPKIVIVTGVLDAENILNYAFSNDGIWMTSVSKIKQNFSGTGDLFSSLFTSAFLKSKDLSNALAFATEGCETVLRATCEQNSKELSLVSTLSSLSAIKTNGSAKLIL